MEINIKLVEGQNLWFVSDTHYGHTNICRGVSKWRNKFGEVPEGQTRPFNTIEEMNDRIVEGINSSIGEDDILFHMGDWSFGGFENIKIFRDRINCKNIHLILGNHDHHIKNNRGNVKNLFKSVNKTVTLYVEMPTMGKNKRKIIHTFELFHYPIASWIGMNDGVIHLHGHVHLPPNKRLSEGKAMDVGIDGNYMDPISLNDVLSIMKNQPIKKLSLPSDHHEEEVRN